MVFCWGGIACRAGRCANPYDCADAAVEFCCARSLACRIVARPAGNLPGQMALHGQSGPKTALSLLRKCLTGSHGRPVDKSNHFVISRNERSGSYGTE